MRITNRFLLGDYMEAEKRKPKLHMIKGGKYYEDWGYDRLVKQMKKYDKEQKRLADKYHNRTRR